MKLIFPTLAILAASICQSQAQMFSVTDLGSLGGGGTEASGINNSGQVSGESATASGSVEGFIYSNGVMTAVPNVGPPLGATAGAYETTAINASGQAAGWSEYSVGGVGGDQAFVSSGGVTSPISGIDIVNGIDNAGDVVGYTFTGNNTREAFLNANGTVTNLGNLGDGEDGSYTVANGINNEGQIVGTSQTSAGYGHAFIYNIMAGSMLDLGALGGSTPYSIAWAINDNGQVVGSSTTASGSSHAFLWTSTGGMVDLGTLGYTSRANALNDYGQVVGESLTLSDSEDAFLWENGQMLDLNSLIAPNSGYVLTDATGINDHGQIVVDALDNGNNVAVLLTPTDTPEPSTWALSITGFALLTIWSQRRRASH